MHRKKGRKKNRKKEKQSYLVWCRANAARRLERDAFVHLSNKTKQTHKTKKETQTQHNLFSIYFESLTWYDAGPTPRAASSAMLSFRPPACRLSRRPPPKLCAGAELYVGWIYMYR
jgi:hypothetical protein